MMTKEEVAAIVAYCDEHRKSYKSRLKELGLPEWKFYDSKRKYEQQSSGTEGDFLQLVPGGLSANPIKPRRRRTKTVSDPEHPGMLSVEIKTGSGVMMRVQGEMNASLLKTIIQATMSDV